MISGNCAIGSACMATRPLSTVTMAMTIATMGRPTKNRDMMAMSSLRAVGGRRERQRLHLGPVAQRRPFDDDAGAGFDAAGDDPAATDTVAGHDRARSDLVA